MFVTLPLRGSELVGLARLITICLIFTLVGCGDQTVRDQVRYVDGWKQFTGRNGLGVYRRMWEQAGARCFAPKRLSDRLKGVDVIVLVSNTFDPPGKQAREWIEEWLREQPGRSVIYFGRDFDASQYYYERTIGNLSPSQQLLAHERMAQLRVYELQGKLNSYSNANIFCEWFCVKSDQPARNISLDSEKPLTGWPVSTQLWPPDPSFRELMPESITATKDPNPLEPVDKAPDSTVQKVLIHSEWDLAEFETEEQWNAAFENLLDSETLLESSDGIPLVFRLTSESRLGDGQILVVANGAPFLNASIVEPPLAKISESLIQECLPAQRVALLAYDDRLTISMVDEADARGTGLEMFLHWPLRPIMILAAILMLVTCACYLPALGRGQDLAKNSTSDFGQHVEAIGNLIRQANDEAFARNTIANYFRNVRGEAPPPWLDDPSTE